MPWADRTPLERAQLDYCAPRGIPLSVFGGRTVYPGDPQWLEDDMGAALEWQAEQARKCPDCGEPADEAMKLENEYAYRAKASRCHSCYAINAEDARLAGGKPPKTAGYRYRVTMVETGGESDEPQEV